MGAAASAVILSRIEICDLDGRAAFPPTPAKALFNISVSSSYVLTNAVRLREHGDTMFHVRAIMAGASSRRNRCAAARGNRWQNAVSVPTARTFRRGNHFYHRRTVRFCRHAEHQRSWPHQILTHAAMYRLRIRTLPSFSSARIAKRLPAEVNPGYARPRRAIMKLRRFALPTSADSDQCIINQSNVEIFVNRHHPAMRKGRVSWRYHDWLDKSFCRPGICNEAGENAFKQKRAYRQKKIKKRHCGVSQPKLSICLYRSGALRLLRPTGRLLFPNAAALHKHSAAGGGDAWRLSLTLNTPIIAQKPENAIRNRVNMK